MRATETTTLLRWICRVVVVSAMAVMPASASAENLKFTEKLLTMDSNEGCAVADVNNDGRPDVIAGRNWYAAPDFAPRPLRLIEDWRSYVQSNGDFAYDVNGDGRVDVIAGSWYMTQVYWYENPGPDGLSKGRLWQQHLLKETGVGRNEIQFLHDLDGDGVPEWVVNDMRAEAPLLAWKFAKDDKGQPTLKKIVLGPSGNGHGMGFGDINGDGREDILVGSGWHERPDGNPITTQWKFRPDWKWRLGSCPVLVVDLDGDGRNDIIRGNAHDFGLYWDQQLPPDPDGKTNWRRRLIDKSWSQPHCLHWADLDGDGQAELITGKRVRGHGGKDPGGDAPPCLYYYTWDKKAMKFTRHTIDVGHVGAGLQIRTADLNGDGRLDIAVAGKSGTYILFNKGQ